ncbi:unnamed protein product, partial [Symbiodinium pilosum]
ARTTSVLETSDQGKTLGRYSQEGHPSATLDTEDRRRAGGGDRWRGRRGSDSADGGPAREQRMHPAEVLEFYRVSH